jgi:hypothetical protein
MKEKEISEIHVENVSRISQVESSWIRSDAYLTDLKI